MTAESTTLVTNPRPAVDDVLDAVAAPLVVLDEAGRATRFNQGMLDLLRLEPTDLVGRRTCEFGVQILATDGTELPTEWYPTAIARRTGRPVDDAEIGIRRRDGGLMWVTVSTRLVDPDDPGAGLVATLREISNERAALRALRTVEAADRVLLCATSEAALMADMCAVVVEQGPYSLTWIGTAEDDGERSVTIRAAAGATDYLYPGIVSWSGDEPRGRGPVGTALREARTVLVHDHHVADEFAPWVSRAQEHGFSSMLAIPLSISDRPSALTIYSHDGAAFDDESVRLLTRLGQHLEYGLDNLRRVRHLNASLEATVATISNITEARDPYTAGHQRRVAELSGAIAADLGLDERSIGVLRLGALVHDIGKIAIPAELLSRPGALEHAEYELMKAHSARGEIILRDAALPWPVPEIAAQHHERLDGSGYPAGLVGAEIILPARIVAVADVVEAIVHHRPYRPALGLDVALAVIWDGAERLFDRAIVESCERVLRAGFEFNEP